MPSKNTKKKMKQAAQNQRPQKVESQEVQLNAQNENLALETENEQAVAVETVSAEQPVETKKEEPKKEEAQKETKKEAKKSKKEGGKLKRKTKEVFSELKKVTWPTFGQVMKKTGTVLVVVLCFAVVLLGIDTVLELAYKAFIGGLNG